MGLEAWCQEGTFLAADGVDTGRATGLDRGSVKFAWPSFQLISQGVDISPFSYLLPLFPASSLHEGFYGALDRSDAPSVTCFGVLFSRESRGAITRSALNPGNQYTQYFSHNITRNGSNSTAHSTTATTVCGRMRKTLLQDLLKQTGDCHDVSQCMQTGD